MVNTLVDLDAEGGALACLLMRLELVGRAPLEPADFYAERHRRVFEAVRRVAKEGERGTYMRLVPKRNDCPLVRVMAALRESCRLAQVGGAGYLVELLALLDGQTEGLRAFGLSALFEAHALRVRRLAEGRRALELVRQAEVELAGGSWRTVPEALAPLRAWVAA